MQNTLSEEEIRLSHLLQSNPVKLFLETEIELSSDDESISKRQLYEQYSSWAITKKAKYKNEVHFHRDLRKEFPDIPIKQINRIRHYIGISQKNGASISDSIPADIPISRLSYREKILFLIKAGPENGLYTDDLMKQLFADNYTDAEKIRSTLDQILQNGECYQPRPDYFNSWNH